MHPPLGPTCQVDALWHPETFLIGGPGCAAVSGVENLRPDRLGVPCAICHLTHGAVAKCCQSGCPHAFHPLCARNCGLYLGEGWVGGQRVMAWLGLAPQRLANCV